MLQPYWVLLVAHGPQVTGRSDKRTRSAYSVPSRARPNTAPVWRNHLLPGSAYFHTGAGEGEGRGADVGLRLSVPHGVGFSHLFSPRTGLSPLRPRLPAIWSIATGRARHARSIPAPDQIGHDGRLLTRPPAPQFGPPANYSTPCRNRPLCDRA